MAEFQPILVKTDRAVPYKEGQMIVCSVSSQPPSANNWVPGVYVDLNGTRQMLTMQGPQGERGQQGIPGATGAKGDPGKDGVPGKDGKQGPAGPQGLQGARGLMGPNGAPGPTGPQGAQGEQGPKGDKGDPGPGIKAWYHSVAEMEADFATSTVMKGELVAINSEDTAEDGRVYVKGTAAWEYWITMRGLQGPKGEQGIQGPMGAQGTQGRGFNWAGGWTAAETYALDDVVEHGSALYVCLGETAAGDEPGVSDKWQVFIPQGPRGEQGPAGPQGIQGVPGPKGDKGDKGDTGAQGLQGVKGDTGATGPAGPMGPQGPRGAQGPQGPRGSMVQLTGIGSEGIAGIPSDATMVCVTFWVNLEGPDSRETFTCWFKANGDLQHTPISIAKSEYYYYGSICGVASYGYETLTFSHYDSGVFGSVKGNPLGTYHKLTYVPEGGLVNQFEFAIKDAYWM